MSRLPVLRGLLALGAALALVATGASGAFASGSADDLATVQAKLDGCRKDLKDSQADIKDYSALLAKAKRGSFVLIQFPRGFVPVQIEEAEFWINLELRAGKITPKKAVELARYLGKLKATTIRSLTGAFNDERAHFTRTGQRCATLAAERDRLLDAGDSGGSFVLKSTIKVTNPNAPELTIDAAGGTALWNHTGVYGGAGKGGEWKIEYTFKVPRTLSPGKSSSISLSLEAGSVKPEQPLSIGMSATAPDFKGTLSINYPSPAKASKVFTFPISAGYKDFKEIEIRVGVVSAEVIYTYQRVGG